MNKIKKSLVVGIGELVWDMLPGGKRAGGAPANFVYHAAQAGTDGFVISAVGQDADGAELLRELEKYKIFGVIAQVSPPTGRVNVMLKRGMPSYEIVENVAWDYLPFTAEAADLLGRADAVCYGTLACRNIFSRQTIERLLASVPEQAIRFFDVNLRQNYFSKELIERLLAHANILKLNEEELVILRSLFGWQGSNEDICRLLSAQYNLRYLILTQGARCSTIYTAQEISQIETPQVKTEDTVGAGDAFSGAFVSALLRGETVKQAHETAVKTATFVCTRAGAWPEYPVDF